MLHHPWKCNRGHENRTPIPPESRKGPRRRIVLWCAEPGCTEQTAIFVGESEGPPPARKPRRPGPEKGQT